ncbi:hypothetical protein [Streptomyces sp. 6N223]|uniref:hypothetical protein n=1 Tax=Streptomyces sp. 6N223 TaxID=3457412 RepID=UPI003FD0D4CE
MAFTGREHELRILNTWLGKVVAGTGGAPGQALVLKGRRRVGKTRLVQEFCARSGRPRFVGSVKWRDDAPFDGRDLAGLAEQARYVPGAEEAALVAVSRCPASESAREGLAAWWGPEELLRAW